MISDYLELFPGASRDRPRFMALAETVLRQAADFLPVIGKLQSAFSVGEADGVQLDMLAKAFGLKRPDGETDTAFRQYVLSKLALWRWNGTNEGVPEVMEQIALGSTMTDNRNGTVTVTGTVSAGLVPVPAGIYAVNVL